MEFRSQWFHLHRPPNEEELIRILEPALQDKLRKIERQYETAGHQAAYDPAGAGSPWISIGPRNINGRIRCLTVHPTDPNTVYAGAASAGACKSTNAGLTSQPLLPHKTSL